jgi:hypothetical protein
MVGPDGNAPSSLAYRASALLLSYEPMAVVDGVAPLRFSTAPRFSRPFGKLLPATTESPRGRNCTCVVPLRRRRPGLLGHAEKAGPHGGTPTRNAAFEALHDDNFTTRGKWSPRQELHLEPGLRTAV